MLKIISTMLLAGCFALTATAQTTEGTTTTTETISKANPNVSIGSTSTPVRTTGTSTREATEGDYNQMDKRICKWMKSGKIPADFPKYESTMTDEQYQVVMRKYLKDNKELVKEQFHHKL